ncbi:MULTISPECIES: copper resistance protein NlpE N-terminal domain-containing protein [unclassified Imperialibacter]|uniref:copper resistance protein NlpE N-terminal domain-containing protein n=1 Tax=unclassified Imperialibacter TaxID=2629706 RepID=UPI001257C990|nr:MULTISPECIES: copper resistance protein NlpE N-terminal domain-containing protein [unclassified Imperialibacter]CAD5282003.1 Heat shock protein HslJ [Imperialibacter sp. 89]CAD5287566.1 Heat shock protein HslJ [Imperialibacter sp. 75]VVT30804.1 Heat shock protein HslJ [Imperialibacter sp. EC-SDR9]
MTKRSMIGIMLSVALAGCVTEQKAQKTTQTVLPTSSDNSQTSLDWPGTYRGILPCGDCEGIKTALTLNESGSYELSTMYEGKSEEVFTEKGSFAWNNTGSAVTLTSQGGKSTVSKYQVGENQLFKLDKDGKWIQGDLASRYILKKSDFDQQIAEKYWKLIELRGQKVTMSKDQPKEQHFVLHTADDRISGYGGCNSFNGSYTLSEIERINFSPLAATRMACRNDNNENAFLSVFEEADNYSIRNDTLLLNKARMAPLAKFVAVYFK